MVLLPLLVLFRPLYSWGACLSFQGRLVVQHFPLPLREIKLGPRATYVYLRKLSAPWWRRRAVCGMKSERGRRRRWDCLRAVLVTVSVIALACWSRQVHTLPSLRPRLQHRPPRLRPAADVSDAQFSTLAAVVRQGGMANLSTALGTADLFITFGSSSLLPFVLNWVGTLRHHGVWRLMVGALDEEMRAACEASGVPTLHIGAANQRRGAGGYFRKDYEAFKRMGLAKVRTMHVP